jgi:hypothetical protein
LWVVDIEDGDCGAANLGAADQDGLVPLEVPFLRLPPRIKKSDNVVGERVFSGQIRPLPQVASVTTPRSILRVVGAAVLLGNHVLDVEGGCGGGEVGEMAILTPMIGPFPDQMAKGPWHQASAERLRSPRALACKIAMKSIVWT